MTSTATFTSRAGAHARIYQAAIRLFAERGADVVTVSELADAAGIARGTVYNNIRNPDALFSDIAGGLAGEMIARVEATMAGIDDPVTRLSTGLRLFVRRAHNEPDWGRFMVRFLLSHDALRHMMDNPPARDIAQSIETARFKTEPAKIKALVSMLAGSVQASMYAVLSGHQTWREAGSDAAELFLRAGGVGAIEAKRIARSDLPQLAPAGQLGSRRQNAKKRISATQANHRRKNADGS